MENFARCALSPREFQKGNAATLCFAIIAIRKISAGKVFK
jgi:hypothetical protein